MMGAWWNISLNWRVFGEDSPGGGVALCEKAEGMDGDMPRDG